MLDGVKRRKGTCAVCFGEFAVTVRDQIQRHGWKESGGRRAGHYGLTTHSGECFGVGYPPYEYSKEGTEAYLGRLEGALQAEKRTYLQLEAGPAVLTYFALAEGYVRGPYGLKREQRPFQMELRPTDPSPGTEYSYALNKRIPARHTKVRVEEIGAEIRVPTYPVYLEQRLQETTSRIEGIIDAIDFCEKKVAAWKPAELW